MEGNPQVQVVPLEGVQARVSCLPGLIPGQGRRKNKIYHTS